MKPFIKICCIASPAEARLAIDAGADAIGLVSWMPSGPGVIDDAAIRDIVGDVAGDVETFLLTSRRAAKAILEQLAFCRPSAVQLVDAVEGDVHRAIRDAMPEVRIVQVLHVTGGETIAEARELAGEVDLILLDSGNPGLAIKQLGGTGRTHDWDISRRLIAAAGPPVLLAGGLDAANVARAIDQARPHGVDVCGGVRRDGDLDAGRLAAFVAAARGGVT